MAKPIFTIKYKNSKKDTVSIEADSCSGEVPAYSSTFYWIFYLGKDATGRQIQVARTPEKRLLPGYAAQVKQLYGRPWMEKIEEMPKVRLTPWTRYESDLGGLPDDTIMVWHINTNRDAWLIEQDSGITLHVMNNEEVFIKGNFREALKQLWPDKSIEIVSYHSTVETIENKPIDPFEL
jgi:hypothetical protein